MNLSSYVVEDAAYQAWLLRLAFPQALPASLAHEILRFYSGLSPAQLGQVLKHSDPTPVFTELSPEQLAVTYLSADVGYTQPEQVAQALYVSGVFPQMRTALDVAEVLYSPTVFPTLEKESMRHALKAANLPEDGINEAISKLYSSVELNPPENLTLLYDRSSKKLSAFWDAAKLPAELAGHNAVYAVRIFLSNQLEKLVAQTNGLTGLRTDIALENGSLLEGQEYTASVKVSVGTTESAWSDLSATLKIEPFLAPQHIRVEAIEDTVLLLQWEGVTGAFNYEIQMTDTNNNPLIPQPMFEVGGNMEGKVDLSTLASGGYIIRVRGIFESLPRTGLHGPWSEPVRFEYSSPLSTSRKVNFGTNPPRCEGISLVHNDGFFDNDHMYLDISENVTLGFNWDAAATPNQTLAFNLYALVSRLGSNEGFSPVNVLINGYAFVNEYTVPGAGYAPHPDVFVIPPNLLVQGENQIMVKTSSNIRSHFWLYRVELTPIDYTVQTDSINFSANPPETSPGLHLTKNESSFRSDHVIVGNGRSVAFRFPLNDDQMRNGHTIAAFTGLVSRNGNQEGYAPVSLRINKQLVTSNFTIAGAGFNPHRVEFFLPASWLNGENVMELQAAPDLRTLFWLYRMEVVHYKYS